MNEKAVGTRETCSKANVSSAFACSLTLSQTRHMGGLYDEGRSTNAVCTESYILTGYMAQ